MDMDTDASRNTYDMEQIAAHAEKMANAGVERFHPRTSMSPPPITPMPMPPNITATTTTRIGAASTATPHDSFEVYNPVDDSFAAWQEDEKDVSHQQHRQSGSVGDDGGGDDYNDTSFYTVKSLPPENYLDESNICNHKNSNNYSDPDITRDTLDALVEEADNMNYSTSNNISNNNINNIDNNISSFNNTPLDDDALARAVAEQDLPPGVSAIEQQEIMMRLLTQQLRRGGGGDWSNDETLSPALEQRMRDFQFAQRKRRETYGNERPWGILGLYDHLGE